MTPKQRAFLNTLKKLFFIDDVPGFTDGQNRMFRADPVSYLIRASDAQAEAIFKELEK
jgi:hypothetical protein